MSQYLNFAIRCNDKFIPINSYSNNNLIYELFSPYVPYEKVCLVTMKMLKNIQEEIDEAIRDEKEELTAAEAERQFVRMCSNPLSEKVEAFTEIKIRVDTLKGLIDDYNNCYSITAFLYGMLDGVKDSNGNENEFLYAGIECRKPTTANIEVSNFS